MKRQILPILCAILCLFATACGANSEANATEEVVIGIIDTGISFLCLNVERHAFPHFDV